MERERERKGLFREEREGERREECVEGKWELTGLNQKLILDGKEERKRRRPQNGEEKEPDQTHPLSGLNNNLFNTS